ncbi:MULTISPECIES: helix-turn-helix domain-containing protein [Anaerotruncus]|uniref:helix-turn-helix domain-containing protein n=1 Tax=Anaerotruncus TaxID=244127 RepID=UPI00082D2FE1|nr:MULTISPECIES: helix-turn-helix transcriptional regulator [Anaerotruncus]RGX56954.1 XRE family transcriptional regulator [Anaerotruncus sp. AF02-27]
MQSEYDKLFGANLRKLRESKKMTQEQLASKLQTNDCDITRSALAKIEVGQRHIYAWEIKALKNALKVPYEELFI